MRNATFREKVASFHRGSREIFDLPLRFGSPDEPFLAASEDHLCQGAPVATCPPIPIPAAFQKVLGHSRAFAPGLSSARWNGAQAAAEHRRRFQCFIRPSNISLPIPQDQDSGTASPAYFEWSVPVWMVIDKSGLVKAPDIGYSDETGTIIAETTGR